MTKNQLSKKFPKNEIQKNGDNDLKPYLDKNNITYYYMKKNNSQEQGNGKTLNKDNKSKLSKDEPIQMLLQQLAQKDEQLTQKDKQIAEQKKVINKTKPKKVREPLPDALEFDLIKELPKAVNVPRLEEDESAFDGIARSMTIEILNSDDLRVQLDRLQPIMKKKISAIRRVLGGVKFLEVLQARLAKFDPKFVTTVAVFTSHAEIVLNEEDIDGALERAKAVILQKFDQFQSEGSAWVVDQIMGHYLNVVAFKPFEGSSYIPLPKELQHARKGLINIKNDDAECFRWCHNRQLNPQKKDPQRIKKKDQETVKQLDYTGIRFPVQIKDIPRIEKQNQIKINVFGYHNKEFFPVYTSEENFEDELNLLLINKKPDEKPMQMESIDDHVDEILEEVWHYVLITDFNGMMCSFTKHQHKQHFCMKCLQNFTTQKILDEHKLNCSQINGNQAVRMPDPTKGEHLLKFNNYHKQQAVPFSIYSDFEAITKKIKQEEQSNGESYTKAYQRHIACGYGYKLVCSYDNKYSRPVKCYRGKDAAEKFIHEINDEVKYCVKIATMLTDKYSKVENLDIESKFETKDCVVCGEIFKKQENRGTWFCQFTGKCKGTAHRSCISKTWINPKKLKVPIIFHNLKGYDSHFIMQEIGKFVEKQKQMSINVIPNNMKKYMAFMLGEHMVFIDSFQFMSQSLDRLVGNLWKDSMKYTSEVFRDRQLELMLRKGVYPYDHMDDFSRFAETELPPKEEFYSILNDQHISDEDYLHAQAVWKMFQLKTMGGYHDLYLKSDVLLLADVFENFRMTCLNCYKLDPCHYFTSPGLAWDAALKMTKITLELLVDVDMYQFIEKGLRGGISYIANRYGKANNKYMKNYDPKSPSKYIMYLDANNLYGWAMCQFLPTGGFRWLTSDKLKTFKLNKYKEDSKRGCILEDPQKLHQLHNDYPLAPQKIKIKEEWLSDHCKKIADKFDIKVGLVHKLVSTLESKEKYVLHYRNLQLYVALGLKVTKIRRVLEFKQSPWLKQYIDFNTQRRTAAKNAFEKDFYKLMNNSVFGKTMENLRKRVDVRLVTNSKKLMKLVASPTYVGCKIINTNLVAVHKTKEVLTLNRPAYLGMSILDLSKTLMYKFHYNEIKPAYPKAKLLFTDTDSLTYEIEAEDVYADFWSMKEKFDNSDYPVDSPFHDTSNKKVIGKMKDEAAGVPITEFVGLRSKMYSYIKENGSGGKTAKGIKKCIIKKKISHENYKETLLGHKQMHHNMKTIRSVKHEISSYEINKVSLSCFDDKRYLLEDGQTSLAYGHYKIAQN